VLHVPLNETAFSVGAQVGWLCTVCEETDRAVSEMPLCCMCPVEGGFLRPTTCSLYLD
jgi:hypothetical protein